MTTATMDRVEELRREQRALERDLDQLPLCYHYPVGSLNLVCGRCDIHARCDAIDREIERLLLHGRAA